MSNFKEEEKYLLEFGKLRRITDTAEDAKNDFEYRERNIWEKLEEKKEHEMKEQEERERKIQREMKE